MSRGQDFQEWYRKAAPELVQAGLWLRGGEINTLPREDFERRPFRALFTRLSTYADTGYSFTHQILYQMASRVEGIYPDLAYLPPRPDAAIFERDGVPWLLGTQSKKGALDFDLVGFSNSIVQELINLPWFLRRSGIPLTKKERLARPEIPILLLGGANALYSSSVWLDEPLVDAVYVGESDEGFRRILEICRDGKAQGLGKAQVLERLEELPGFFQPDRPRATRKSIVLDMNRAEALTEGPVVYIPDQVGSAHLQISEGCPCFCSFCAESWERKPYRERSAKTLVENALKLKASMGVDTIDIYSFNFNLHSELYALLWELAPHFRHIGLKSQRFDLLAHDPEMLKFQQALEKNSLTCGLEGISSRMRSYLSKHLETEDLQKSLEAILKLKMRELKVFLIATGLEEDPDFAELDAMLKFLNDVRKRTDSRTRLIFSMTPLVRFPWTPMEFEDGGSLERYQGIINKTAGRVRAAGFEFREAAELPEYWVSQVLVRADQPGVSRALLRAIERSGFAYYREMSESFRQALEGELRAEGLDPAVLLRGFDLEASRAKPWARVETGVKREFLWERAQMAREYREVDYCLGRSWTKARCNHCGGCPTRFHVRSIVLSEQKREITLDQFKERRRRAQLAERKVPFVMRVGEAGRGVPRKMVAVALARALMRVEPELVPHYRGYAGAFWAEADEAVWVTGRDLLTLYWNETAIPRLQALLKDPAKMERIHQELGAWGRWESLGPDSGWAPRGLAIQSTWEPKPDAYLKARGLKHTLRKQGSDGYAFELIPQAQKKGIVRSLQVKRANAAFSCSVEPGPKFILREFIPEVYSAKREGQLSQVFIESF